MTNFLFFKRHYYEFLLNDSLYVDSMLMTGSCAGNTISRRSEGRDHIKVQLPNLSCIFHFISGRSTLSVDRIKVTLSTKHSKYSL